LRLTRLFFVALRIHFKELSASPFQIMTAAVWPLIFATLAYLMFRAGSGAPSLLYASLGAAVMGIWSTTSTSAGGAIQRQRWQGILELLITAPAPFILVLAPITVAIAALGVYSIGSTILWGRLLFGVPLHVEHPLLFALSIPIAVLSVGMLGLVLSCALVLYRQASAFSQCLEYRVFFIGGAMSFPALFAWILRLEPVQEGEADDHVAGPQARHARSGLRGDLAHSVADADTARSRHLAVDAEVDLARPGVLAPVVLDRAQRVEVACARVRGLSRDRAAADMAVDANARLADLHLATDPRVFLVRLGSAHRDQHPEAPRVDRLARAA